MPLIQEHEERFAEVARRGMEIYERKLRALLEPEQNGRAVAIHPDSGEYVVADTLPEARRLLRERHPDGMTTSRTIGAAADEDTLRRLFPGRKQ